LERRFRHIDLSLLFKIQSCKMCKPFVFGGQTYVVVSAAMFKHHDCSPFLLTRGWGVPSEVVSVILRFSLLFKIQRSKMCKPLVFVCQTYVSVPAAMLKNHYCSTILAKGNVPWKGVLFIFAFPFCFKIQSCKMCKPFVFGGQTYFVVPAAMFKNHDCSPFLITRGVWRSFESRFRHISLFPFVQNPTLQYV